MKKNRILKDKEEKNPKEIKYPLFRIFLWFAMGSIILAVSIPRILGSSEIQLAPIIGTILGFLGIGMGLGQIIYFSRLD